MRRNVYIIFNVHNAYIYVNSYIYIHIIYNRKVQVLAGISPSGFGSLILRTRRGRENRLRLTCAARSEGAAASCSFPARRQSSLGPIARGRRRLTVRGGRAETLFPCVITASTRPANRLLLFPRPPSPPLGSWFFGLCAVRPAERSPFSNYFQYSSFCRQNSRVVGHWSSVSSRDVKFRKQFFGKHLKKKLKTKC